jgi:hypothetical protein
MGSDYWSGLLEWLRRTAVGAGNVWDRDVDLMTLTDDVDEAVQIVCGTTS